jgi:hypothetical protein
MGWWSTDILGGDSPLDWQSVLYKGLDIPYFDDEHTKVGTHDGLGEIKPSDINRAKQNELIDFIKQETQGQIDRWGESDDRSIAMQVLSLMIMKSGAKTTKKNKKELIKWIRLDEWATEEHEREEHISDLVDAINKYDGTPMKYKGKGLFQQIAERINGIDESKPKGFII